MRKELSIDIIEKWLKDSDWRIRAAAMNACQGKNVPLDIIEKGLKDSDCDVRAAAMTACQERGIPVPAFRTFEPPANVYKKCLFGVIVVATIPADAETRGRVGGKCRSNKALIVDIIGDVAGVKVGISQYDQRTTYFVGDEVVVEDFDRSEEECSRGFHFFCTREEAEAY